MSVVDDDRKRDSWAGWPLDLCTMGALLVRVCCRVTLIDYNEEDTKSVYVA
jgi:hypothetical protein